jgi:DNA invertase Pin-like site-specific DNA recombinase
MRFSRKSITWSALPLRQGDVLVVWKFDCLGRGLRHLINTVHDLTTQGTSLKVLTGHAAAFDTTTAAGKLASGFLPRWPSLSMS